MLQSNNLSHATSFVPSIRDRYFASVEEGATIGFLHELQMIGSLPNWKMYPEVDLQFSVSLVKSTSVYSLSLLDSPSRY
jgi:hypothetical protein